MNGGAIKVRHAQARVAILGYLEKNFFWYPLVQRLEALESHQLAPPPEPAAAADPHRPLKVRAVLVLAAGAAAGWAVAPLFLLCCLRMRSNFGQLGWAHY